MDICRRNYLIFAVLPESPPWALPALVVMLPFFKEPRVLHVLQH